MISKVIVDIEYFPIMSAMLEDSSNEGVLGGRRLAGVVGVDGGRAPGDGGRGRGSCGCPWQQGAGRVGDEIVDVDAKVLIQDDGVRGALCGVPKRLKALDVEGLRDSLGTAGMKAVRHGPDSLDNRKWPEPFTFHFVVLVGTKELREITPNLVADAEGDRFALGGNDGSLGSFRAGVERKVPAEAQSANVLRVVSLEIQRKLSHSRKPTLHR